MWDYSTSRIRYLSTVPHSKKDTFWEAIKRQATKLTSLKHLEYMNSFKAINKFSFGRKFFRERDRIHMYKMLTGMYVRIRY